jgi:hypothetical protein
LSASRSDRSTYSITKRMSRIESRFRGESIYWPFRESNCDSPVIVHVTKSLLQTVKSDGIKLIVKQYSPVASYPIGTDRATLPIPVYQLALTEPRCQSLYTNWHRQSHAANPCIPIRTDRATLPIPVYHSTNQLHNYGVPLFELSCFSLSGYFSNRQANISLSTLHGELIMFHVMRCIQLLMLMSCYLAG